MLVGGRCAAPALGDGLRVTVQASAPASSQLLPGALHLLTARSQELDPKQERQQTHLRLPPPVSPGASGEPGGGGAQGPGRGQAQATPLAKAGGEPLPNARVPAPPSLVVETRPQGGGLRAGAAACYPPAGARGLGIPLAIPDQEAERLCSRGRGPEASRLQNSGCCTGCALHDSRGHAHCTHRGGACLLTLFLAGGSHSNPGQSSGLSFPIYSVGVGTYAGGHQGALRARPRCSNHEGAQVRGWQGVRCFPGTISRAALPEAPRTPPAAWVPLPPALGFLCSPPPHALWAQPAPSLWAAF